LFDHKGIWKVGCWLPGLRIMRHYEVRWLRHDIAAGLVLTTMLLPVGVAYAVASGMPGIYGLYATIVPLLTTRFLAQAGSSCWGYLRRRLPRQPGARIRKLPTP
jgi:MFS superfamily sulfate permease-like transporter